MNKRLEMLIKKYNKYIQNIKWHIETNKPKGKQLSDCQNNVIVYEEVVKDLTKLSKSATI